MVAAGAEHTVAITADGKLYGWGWGRYGNLGLGDIKDRALPAEVVTLNVCPKSLQLHVTPVPRRSGTWRCKWFANTLKLSQDSLTYSLISCNFFSCIGYCIHE